MEIEMTTSLEFFDYLNWLDGGPLLPMIEPYRRRLFTSALDTFGPDGLPTFNFVLAGRGKKNNKTLDLVLAAFYKLLIPESVQGNDGYIVASDEDQAGDDLSLAKKLIAANRVLEAELEVYQKEIRRRDARGTLPIITRQTLKTAPMAALSAPTIAQGTKRATSGLPGTILRMRTIAPKAILSPSMRAAWRALRIVSAILTLTMTETWRASRPGVRMTTTISSRMRKPGAEYAKGSYRDSTVASRDYSGIG